ncbi:MAG TPA: adenylate/guanylate cyclase domain-containing protein, partial [Minicystis sp.]|nr:adenylate/guanylate cyclase domain-containing protein [Minicystis sp.]
YVTAGEVAAMIVGGVEQRWELVVVGPPFAELSTFPPVVPAGQVLVSRRAWELVAADVEGEPIDGGAVRAKALTRRPTLEPLAPADPAALAVAAMSAFVPRSVLHALEMGDAAWVAENRRVTAAFLQIGGVDVGASGALASIQGAFSAVQTAVYRHQGSINQFLFDDKGLVVLALWGVPSRTHEDDPARAIEAMLEAEAAMRARGLEAAVGITTERVFCGHRGSATRREYAVIGRSVNLAARLMAAAGKPMRVA